MIFIGTDLEIVTSTKKFLSAQFSMKDLEAADVILGIKIMYIKCWIGLSQSHYKENMIKKYATLICQSCQFHMTTIRSFNLTVEDW